MAENARERRRHPNLLLADGPILLQRQCYHLLSKSENIGMTFSKIENLIEVSTHWFVVVLILFLSTAQGEKRSL